MFWLAILPFVAQAIVMLFDEGIFHLRRGLPLWERIGHPIDTTSVLACMLFVLFVPFSMTAMKVYIGLALFSTLLVTKDEFVHKHHCPWAEQWLHAVLFTLHPITLAMAGFIWPVVQGYEVSPWIATWLSRPDLLHQFLSVQAWAMGLFLFYQIIYWNVLWREKNV
jgi:hypothetical protein